MAEDRVSKTARCAPIPFHPFLFALHPVVSLYAANVSLVPVQDVLAPILVTLGGVSVIWMLAGLLLRDVRRAAVVASTLGYFFYLYDVFYRQAQRLDLVWYDADRVWIGPAVWGAFAAGLIFLASRPWKVLPTLTVFLNVTGCAMVGLASYSAIGSLLSISRQLQAAQIQLAKKQTSVALKSLPDIYYIVLDGYGRADALKAKYKLDNSPLIEALRKRGFFVADRARTNYVQTELSLASSTNFDYLQDLPTPRGSPEDIRGILDGMIDNSRLSQLAKGFGYQYLGVATGFPALRFASADVTYQGDSGQSLYVIALLEKTPIQTSERVRNSMFEERFDLLRASFENLKRIGGQAGPPKLVVAHVLAPHPPFVMKGDGSFTAPKRAFAYYDASDFISAGGTREEYMAGYTGQVKALNRLLLGAIDSILTNKGREAVILLQGDHGPKLGLDQNRIEKTDLAEALPILLACKGPDTLIKELGHETSPVNLTRSLARMLFGQDLPVLQDRSYYSPWLAPYQFVEAPALAPRMEN